MKAGRNCDSGAEETRHEDRIGNSRRAFARAVAESTQNRKNFPSSSPAYDLSMNEDGPFTSLLELLLDHDLPPLFLPNLREEDNPEIFGAFQRLVKRELSQQPENPADLQKAIEDSPTAVQKILAIMEMAGHLPTPKEFATWLTVAKLETKYFPLDRWLENTGKVLSKFPEIMKRFDEDGLLVPSARMRLGMTGVEYRGCLLYYHQFMRRHFRSGMNTSFFGSLLPLSSTVKVSLAIDLHQLVSIKKFRERIEEDYWYEPKFGLSSVDNPRHHGLTVHLGDPGNLFFQSLRTEFYSQVRKVEKSIEIEEIVPIEGRDFRDEKFVVCRYIHTIRNMETTPFRASERCGPNLQ